MDKKFFKKYEDHLDELTKVYQRDVIIEYLDKLISENKPFSFGVLDIDNFKFINDGYGHLFGDDVLREFGKALKESLEGVGVVGRYGGDEFLIVVENVVDYDVIWEIWHDLLGVSDLIDVEEIRKLNITVTLGSSRFPKDSTSIDGLFEVADKALYRGKMKGRNCFIIYLPEKHANISLKSERDKVVSSQYLHCKAMTTITSGGDLGNNIKETINFFGNYFMLDHFCIQANDSLYYEYFHSLCKKKDFKPVQSKLIELGKNSTTGLFYKNTFILGEESTKIDKICLDEGIFSSAYVEIKVHNKSFGYLRADVTENVRGRIWQSLELDILETIAHTIALELYYQQKEIKDL